MWKIYIALTAILLVQFGVLFGALSSGWMDSANGLLHISILVLVIGCVGIAVVWLLKRKVTEEKTKVDTIALWAAALLSTLGVYVAIIPLMIILSQGTIEAVLLIIGLAVPAFVPSPASSRRATKNA